MGVVCIKVMVKRKGGDESAEGGSVHDKKQRTENGTLGYATGGGVEGRESVIIIINVVYVCLDACLSSVCAYAL